MNDALSMVGDVVTITGSLSHLRYTNDGPILDTLEPGDIGFVVEVTIGDQYLPRILDVYIPSKGVIFVTDEDVDIISRRDR
jgi:hypothetical protein